MTHASVTAPFGASLASVRAHLKYGLHKGPANHFLVGWLWFPEHFLVFPLVFQGFLIGFPKVFPMVFKPFFGLRLVEHGLQKALASHPATLR